MPHTASTNFRLATLSRLEGSFVITLAQIQYLVALLTSVVRRATTHVDEYQLRVYDMKTSFRMPVTLCVNQI